MSPYLIIVAIATFFSVSHASCAAQGFLECTNGPADFCCGPATHCITLAGNTTILCCPNGSDCFTIQPIVCDISEQDNTLHPDNALKTTVLTGTLKSCGTDNKCCPYGYTCNPGGNCVKNADQSKVPKGFQKILTADSSISSSSRSDVTGSPTTTASTSTNAPPSATSAKLNPKSKSISIPPATLAAVVISIAIAVALISAFTFWWYSRKRKPTTTKYKHASKDIYEKAEMDASSLLGSKQKAQELEGKRPRAQELEARAMNVQELEGSGGILHELEANAVRKSRMFRRSFL